MNPSSSQSNEDQDWELLSGSKSLTAETEVKSTDGILSLKEKRGKNEENEDWYITIPPPATPANTPEYTPNPSAGLRKESNSEASELFPIPEVKEDTNDEAGSDSQADVESSCDTGEYFEYTPVDSDSEDQTVRTWMVVKDWMCRVAAYLVVITVVKWAAAKLWGKLSGFRKANEFK